MTTKKTTVLMAAMLAVATVLAAGLTVLPSSVQEAQANPCSTNIETSGGDVDNDDVGASGGVGGAASTTAATSSDQTCNFVGPVEFDED